MGAKVTRRSLLEMAATRGAALSVAATAAKPALAQDTAPRGNPVGNSGQNDYDVFDLGDVAFQSGITLPRAKLAYKTYGSPGLRWASPSAFLRHRLRSHKGSAAPDPETGPLKASSSC
jgi:hypothetical protein